MNKKPKFICSRCDRKRPEIECFCERCFKETFDMPFGFIKSKGLLNEYDDYIEAILKKRWVKATADNSDFKTATPKLKPS